MLFGAYQVIQEWADFDSAGYSFERGRMEKTVQALCFGDNAATVPASIAAGPSQGQKLKKDDVEFIVSGVAFLPWSRCELSAEADVLDLLLEWKT